MRVPPKVSVRIQSVNHKTENLNRDTSLLRESEAGGAGRNIVDNVLALEEDVTEDVEANAIVGLNSTEACAGARGERSVVDELARHGLGDAADGDGEVGQSSGAREHVATLCVVDLGTGDLGVVRLCDRGVDVDQGCAGVDDTGDATLDGCCGTDAVSGGGETPETLARIHVDVGDGAGVLCAVDETKVVGTSGVVLKVNSEELLSKAALDGVEEGLLRSWRDGVDGAEGQSEKAVGVLILAERRRHGSSSLYGLRGGSHASNGDLVSVDLAGRTRTVAVADLPGVAALDLGGIDLVVVVAGKLGGGLEGGKDPARRSLALVRRFKVQFGLQISRSGVEVKVDSGGSDGDGAKVGRVVVVAGVGGLRAL